MTGVVHITSAQSQLLRALGRPDSLGCAIVCLGVALLLVAVTLLLRLSPYPAGPVGVILAAVAVALLLHFVAYWRDDPRIHALAFSAWFAAGLGFGITSIPDILTPNSR